MWIEIKGMIMVIWTLDTEHLLELEFLRVYKEIRSFKDVMNYKCER